jgi:hypothetical protein
MPSLNCVCKMNPERLKAIRDVLRAVADELDSEIHSDTSVYTLNLDYNEVLDYFKTDDNDGEAD